jgi:hypothetical protein
MTMQEAESLIGRNADGSAVDFQQGSRTLAKKTYTWNGLLWHYTLTAHYSKEKDPHLIEYKTDGADIPQEPAPAPGAAPVAVKTDTTKGGGGSGRRGGSGKGKGKGGATATGSPPADKPADDSKTAPTATSDKPAEPKSDNGDKAAAPYKPAAPSDSAPKDSPKPASDKTDASKPATDPPAPKPSP